MICFSYLSTLEETNDRSNLRIYSVGVITRESSLQEV